MRLASVVLTSWISSFTSKISWIVVGLAQIMCVSVCECVSVSVCNWFYKLIHGPQKQILIFFFVLSGNLDFGLEKSWKNHGTFFLRFLWEPWEWDYLTKMCANIILPQFFTLCPGGQWDSSDRYLRWSEFIARLQFYQILNFSSECETQHGDYNDN